MSQNSYNSLINSTGMVYNVKNLYSFPKIKTQLRNMLDVQIYESVDR